MADVTVTYIPLDRLKVLLGLEAASLTTADEERLQTALRAATAQVEQVSARRFAPRQTTIDHAFNPHEPTQLLLDDDLLQLNSVTNGDGTALVDTDLEMIGNGVLHLRNGLTFNAGDGDQSRPIAVTGVWGWHDHPADAWQWSGDVIDAVLSPSGTATLPVQDADGPDLFRYSPRFRAGQLLQVGLEYMSLISSDAENNTLSVIRGVQGSLTTDHEPGETIFIYQPPAQVERLILRWTAWLYKEPENRAAGGTPSSLIAEAEALRRVSVKA